MSINNLRISKQDDDNEDEAKNDHKRRFQFVSLMKEIVATERNYVTDLETIVEVFHNPLRSNKLLNSKEIQTIFCNIHDVLRINKVILSEIKIQLPEIEKEASFETMQMYCIELCNIFLKYGDMLKVYTFYCNNKATQLQALTEAQRKSKAFAEFLQKQTQTEFRCKKLSLETLLSIPFQRICKYPLLFKELAKNTLSCEPQYYCLDQICTKLNNILAQVNDNKRIAENIDKMVSLRNAIDQLPSDLELLIPARRFIREGDIMLFADNAYKPRHMFLFNDMLLIAKKARLGGTYHYVGHVAQQDQVTINDENKYGIRIEYKTKDQKYSILAPSSSEQQEWMQLIQETLRIPSNAPERHSVSSSSYSQPLPPSRDSILEQRRSLARSSSAMAEPEKQPTKRSSITSYGTPTGFSYLASTSDAAPHRPLTHAKANVRMHQTQQIVGACLDDLIQAFSQAYKAYKSNAPVKHNTSSMESIIRTNISKMKALNNENEDNAKADTMEKIESSVELFMETLNGWMEGLVNKRPPTESEVKLLQKLQSQRKKIGDMMVLLNK